MAPTYNYQASHLQSFQHALKAGEEFEQKVIKLLKKAGHEAWKSKDRSYDLDVALDVPLYGAHRITAECKMDFMASTSGNLALEVLSGGKPSGIHPHGPNPDLWCHGIDNEVWLMKTRAIQDLCVMHRMTWGNKYVPVGDKFMKAQAILMPITVARKAVGGAWVKL